MGTPLSARSVSTRRDGRRATAIDDGDDSSTGSYSYQFFQETIMQPKRIIQALSGWAALVLAAIPAYTQTPPVISSGGTQQIPGGVWSKNMELIRPLDLAFS